MKTIKFCFFLALVICTKNVQAQTLQFKIGDKAPVFSAMSHSGNNVNLDELTAKGPVVLFFYRGYWCPFCNKQLSELQDSLQLLTGKGATVLAVTPEASESVDKTITKTKATYQIISDTTNSILKKYGVDFKVEDKTVERYKGFGLDFAKVNGNNENVLPVPGVFIIGKDGNFKYLFFNTDYRKRPTVKELLENL
jgi:peroxiredoxin